MPRAFVLALALAVAGCSSGAESSTARAAAAAHAAAYRGPAVVTGRGDPAACPRKRDLDQYLNDMMNLRVDPDDPGYALARAYDLRNRQCIDLAKGERVQIEGGSRAAESLVRPLDRSQMYWTAADWTRAAEDGNR
ncbi:MAG: hypothetical protein ACREUG_14355 [Steroidobacteraceae bacterium]